MLRLPLLPPVHFLRPDGRALTDDRSSELKVHGGYRTGTNNLLAMRRTPSKIQTEPQDSLPLIRMVKLLPRQEF
jgi:hypothetical protein